MLEFAGIRVWCTRKCSWWDALGSRPPFLPGYALGSANNPQCGVRNPLAVKVPVDPGLERRNSASRGQEDLCYVRKNQGEEKQEGPEPFPAQL